MAKVKCRTCGKAFVGDARRKYCEKHAPPKRDRSRRRPQHLHAVEPGESPPQLKPPKTIEEAAQRGSTIDELRLMRERIARTLDDPNCPPRDLAALSRRQIEISKEIDALRRKQEESDGGVVSDDEAWSSEAI